ncbi:phosphoketolase family protein [Thiomonas sp.]
MASRTKARLARTQVAWLDRWWRATNYIACAQIFLLDNVLLHEPLSSSHIKPRLLGHWGTSPGLNLLYAHLLRAVRSHGMQPLFVAGPGHGAPAVLANAWLEGSYGAVRQELTRDGLGLHRLCREFSVPGGVASHVGPHIPGSLHEGGELGYGLLHAVGAVFDNPDLLALAVVGDGEAETGPAAAAWKSLHFINPVRDGAVLPVLHLNGYRIAAPTVFGRMSDTQIDRHFSGLGWRVLIVEADDPAAVHPELAGAMDAALAHIHAIQHDWREGLASSGRSGRTTPDWPLLVLRTPKGWTGPREVDGLPMEGSFRAHQVPLPRARSDGTQLAQLEAWLRSYRPDELFDAQGRPQPDLLAGLPSERLLPGNCPHADGGRVRIDLQLPVLDALALPVAAPGAEDAESTRALGAWLRDALRANAGSANLRVFSPDELVSNRLDAVFEVTQRCTLQSIRPDDDHLSAEGRVLEVLSEHCCEGWLEGYVLSGRHGLFACYEAFAPIVDSMVNQHVKWLKAAAEVPWRRPLPALNILLTSHTWRQDHNGYSHQGPGFIDNVLNRKHRHVRVYLAPDANCLLAVAQHAFASSDRVNVIVAGKQPMPQWLGLADAISHCATGAGRWRWAEGGAADEPAVVLAAAGDVPTLELLAAADLLRRHVPDLAFRVVNVVNLLALASPLDHLDGLPEAEFDALFTVDRPVLFAFHGYPHVIDGLVHRRTHPQRFQAEGYREEGTTTTPFDMVVRNRISRFDLAAQALDLAGRDDATADALRRHCSAQLTAHALHIRTWFEDLPEVRDWRFPQPAIPASGEGAHQS